MSNTLQPVRICFVLALVVVGLAGAAQAAEVCLDLNDNFAASPPLLYRLNVVSEGGGTFEIVGSATQSQATRIVTGGAKQIGANFEVSLQGTDINPTAGQGPGPSLITHATHVVLNGPTFTAGTFQAAHFRYFQAGQGVGQTLSLTQGTATLVACPPLD